MVKIILMTAVGLLALVGAGCIISKLHLLFYSPDDGVREYVILPISGHIEDVEFRIRGAVARERKNGGRASKIYITDFGADEETAGIAQKMCGEYDLLEWTESGQIEQCIEREFR